MCASTFECVCAYFCVCVCERERERAIDKKKRKRDEELVVCARVHSKHLCVRLYMPVCQALNSHATHKLYIDF